MCKEKTHGKGKGAKARRLGDVLIYKFGAAVGGGSGFWGTWGGWAGRHKSRGELCQTELGDFRGSRDETHHSTGRKRRKRIVLLGGERKGKRGG